jgi:hypothetical protein
MIGWGHMTEALIPVSGFPLSGLIVFLADEIPHPLVVYYRFSSTLTVAWVGYSSTDAATIYCSSRHRLSGFLVGFRPGLD